MLKIPFRLQGEYSRILVSIDRRSAYGPMRISGYDSRMGTGAQGNAVALLIVGVVIALLVSWRVWRGVGTWPRPGGKFTRREDPFSFWLSIALPAAAALFLMVVGGGALLGLW
jgi:hypothetical protein